MAEPINFEHRIRWAELYRKLAIQANSVANLLADPDTEHDPIKLQSLTGASIGLGANCEVIVTALADAYWPSFARTIEEFVYLGGFRRAEHIINHHDTEGNCDGTTY